MARVTRFALQPRWLAWHLLLVVVLVAFGWLGRWQLGSFQTKAGPGQAARPVERAPVPLDSRSRPGGRLGPGDLGRLVRASGTYDPAGTRLVGGRDRRAGAGRGLLVVAMLRTTTGVTPVVRGWVASATDPAVPPPVGPVTVTGLLQRSEDGPPGGGSGDRGRGRLPYVSTVTVLDALPYPPDRLYDGYLALRSEDPAPQVAPVPVAAQAPTAASGVNRWRNLGYALQWWVFAAAAVFFWWVVLRRAAREQQERDRPPADRPPGDAAGASLLAPPRTT